MTITRYGMTGAPVRTAQTRLRAHGAKLLTVDGKFGPATLAAVRAFQTREDLKADGVVGPLTWAALERPTRDEMAARVHRILTVMGWRTDTAARRRQAVTDFQGAWNLGAALEVDGVPGPKTYAAALASEKSRATGGGDLSAHFSAFEYKCKCGGRYGDCRRVWPARELVRACETIRERIGPFTPLSACRCPRHNAAVGGYDRSQHLHGYAIDFATPELTAAQMTSLRVAEAIGIQRSTGLVRHIDLRKSGPDNYPPASGSLTRPYRYYYG